MLKSKDKKTVCLVVLGVAIVTLLTAVVIGLVTGIMELIGQFVELIVTGECTGIFFCIANLLQALLGVAFALVFFLNKKKRYVVNIVLAASLAGLFMIFYAISAVLFNFTNVLDYAYYSMLSSYVTYCLGLIIASVFMIVSDWLARKYAEASAVAENSESASSLSDETENK